ncbi:MAG: phage tail protein, partial [Pseudomonas sp.]
DYAPQGYAFCQGQVLQVNQNQVLFALVGRTYGGDGKTTFGLPDFRGRGPIGFGQGPSTSKYVLGTQGGAETVAITYTGLPAHSHNVSVALPSAQLSGTSGNDFFVDASATDEKPIAGGCLGIVNDGAGTTMRLYHSGKDGSGNALPRVPLASSAANVSMAGMSATGSTDASGSGFPIPVVGPYQTVNFVIALQGLYPMRS